MGLGDQSQLLFFRWNQWLDIFEQFWQIFGNDGPDFGEIDFVIIMGDDVTHSGDGFPGDAGVCGAEVLGESFGGFTDDGDAA